MFFKWQEHDHGGTGFMTPHDVHFRLAQAKLQAHQQVPFDAYTRGILRDS